MEFQIKQLKLVNNQKAIVEIIMLCVERIKFTICLNTLQICNILRIFNLEHQNSQYFHSNGWNFSRILCLTMEAIANDACTTSIDANSQSENVLIFTKQFINNHQINRHWIYLSSDFFPRQNFLCWLLSWQKSLRFNNSTTIARQNFFISKSPKIVRKSERANERGMFKASKWINSVAMILFWC